MQPWELHQQQQQQNQQHQRYRQQQQQHRPPYGPNNRPPIPRPWSMPRPQAPPAVPYVRPQPRPVLSTEESTLVEKIAEMQARNPEVIEMVKRSHQNNPKYHFLFEESPLYPYYQWRVTQQQTNIRSGRKEHMSHPFNVARPPPPPPPLPLPAPLPADVAAGLPQYQEDCNVVPPENTEHKPRSTRRYFELPAGLMVAAITEDHAPYTALQTSKLEDPEFLESIVPGLSTFTDEIPAPKLTDELAQALAGFDKGVRYIFKEGEFEYRDDPIATASDSRSEVADVEMDKDGWGPGVLEKVLWDRRKGSEQRQRWKRRQERTKRRLEGYEVSDTTESSSESSSKTDTSSSTSTSGSSSDSSDSEAVARPTSINKAIGRDNVGFQLLSKLGWQQGTGLGASSEGIVEPIRVPTRFSTVRASARGRFNRRGRGKGKRVERPSLGTGRHKEPIEQQQQPGDAADKVDDDTFASYRKQMSSAYRQTTNQQPGSPEN